MADSAAPPTTNATDAATDIAVQDAKAAAAPARSRADSTRSNGAGTELSLEQSSKSQTFVDRVDLAVTDFFSQSMSKIALNTPQSIESNFRIFHQRIKEKMGGKQSGTVHVTAQPEVDEAVKEVEAMFSYFSDLSKLVEKQVAQLKALNETEQELALFFQQKGYQEKVEDISAMSIDIGKAYSEGVKHRSLMIQSVEGFGEFVKTFKNKAVQDSIDTLKRQETSRVEFDSFAAKLDALQRASALPPTTILGKELPSAPIDTSAMTPAERELEHARVQFSSARNRYQNLSTAIIDKAVLLEMKRDVDYRTQLERLEKIRNGIALRWGGGEVGVGEGAGAEGRDGSFPVGVYQTPMSE
ncbi:hypothetical protein HDU67_006713 [Dinochytrium kinnereticum]|nr:hypothetical protein HDU67_006713 [Dinochytrium kinnereticum]